MKPACPHIRRIADVRLAQWGKTQAEVAAEHKLGSQQFSQLINSVNPTARTLIILSKILKVAISVFFEEDVNQILIALTPVGEENSQPGSTSQE
jgi:transcriptional regulator with XRE-family HTH domain